MAVFIKRGLNGESAICRAFLFIWGFGRGGCTGRILFFGQGRIVAASGRGLAWNFFGCGSLRDNLHFSLSGNALGDVLRARPHPGWPCFPG